MSGQPHERTGQVGRDPKAKDLDLNIRDESYPDIPTDEPRLVGGPATSAVPQSPSALDASLPGDGGEGILSGRPRETGGVRPPKKIPKTDGS